MPPINSILAPAQEESPTNIRAVHIYRLNGLYYNYLWSSWDHSCHCKLLEGLRRQAKGGLFEGWRSTKKTALKKDADDLFRWKGENPSSKQRTKKVYLEGIYNAPPDSDPRINHIYEMDIDRRILSYNSCALYRLDNIPPLPTALSSIAPDHYSGHICLVDRISDAYRWNYQVKPRAGSAHLEFTEPHTLLDLPLELSRLEKTRLDLYASLVGCLMWNSSIAIHKLSVLSHLDQTDPFFLQSCHLLVSHALRPLMARRIGADDDASASKFSWWARREIFVVLRPNIIDSQDLDSVIAKIVQTMNRNEKAQGPTFGIIISLFHILLIRLDKEQDGRVTRTRPLRFLPSFCSRTGHTAGMVALVRLGLLPIADDQGFFKSIILDILPLLDSSSPFMETYARKSGSQKYSVRNLFKNQKGRLPPEVVKKIAAYVTGAKDLAQLASSSLEALDACISWMRYPMFGQNTMEWLVLLQSSVPLPTWDYDDDEHEAAIHAHLFSACFEVTVDSENLHLLLTASDAYARLVRNRYHRSLVALPARRPGSVGPLSYVGVFQLAQDLSLTLYYVLYKPLASE
ncbi:hypothetical protein GLOTRDRAFT_96767 [Gloeophyllum trabeum ATCC 11539]|uniref:Uncharacterized protein n=1 Tax=Gloeophyllum trabeum (strain ATCC 11539 / FP-39264 / Madison 617) TaxID=670483 RepID=S7PTR5_GLOTA|nr:uncharacterized protein GLOTRDRAFT_96767 [Gloeophyllum trabeum ATCC 11539]EPQ50843.1 hypothetical protein GLOTRDRAFT_96767 [Gloeophyllum trabeum ATCC 11539]